MRFKHLGQPLVNDNGIFAVVWDGAGLVRSAIGDPDLRSPSGFDFGLRPPLRMTRRREFGKES